MTERVTIGVPVYRGKRFIEEALTSIVNQTYKDYVVIISVDEEDPESQEICAKFLNDPRFTMVIQPQRLGWMGNMNWLMSQVKTEFWHLQEQDDVIEPHFLEVLVAYARANPAVATIYPDIRVFGKQDFPIIQQSVLGSAYLRQMTLLYERHLGVALIGLSRAEALRAAGGIPGNEVENFLAETAWMAAMARWGELHRVPGELFRKRIHGDNTLLSWFAWPRDKRFAAWQCHCLSMLEQALQISSNEQERRLLWLAAVERLVSPRTANCIIETDGLTPTDRVLMLEGFLHRARVSTTLDMPKLLGAAWDEIDNWSTGFYWIPTKLGPVRTKFDGGPDQLGAGGSGEEPVVEKLRDEVSYLAVKREALVRGQDDLIAQRDALIRAREVELTEQKALARAHNDLFAQHSKLARIREEEIAEHEALARAHNDLFAQHSKLARIREEEIAEHEALVRTHNDLTAQHDMLVRIREKEIAEHEGLARAHPTK